MGAFVGSLRDAAGPRLDGRLGRFVTRAPMHCIALSLTCTGNHVALHCFLPCLLQMTELEARSILTKCLPAASGKEVHGGQYGMLTLQDMHSESERQLNVKLKGRLAELRLAHATDHRRGVKQMTAGGVWHNKHKIHLLAWLDTSSNTCTAACTARLQEGSTANAMIITVLASHLKKVGI